jgi:hypothetical protein
LTTKVLHTYSKFTLSGTMSSVANTKSLQALNCVTGAAAYVPSLLPLFPFLFPPFSPSFVQLRSAFSLPSFSSLPFPPSSKVPGIVELLQVPTCQPHVRFQRPHHDEARQFLPGIERSLMLLFRYFLLKSFFLF